MLDSDPAGEQAFEQLVHQWILDDNLVVMAGAFEKEGFGQFNKGRVAKRIMSELGKRDLGGIDKDTVAKFWQVIDAINIVMAKWKEQATMPKLGKHKTDLARIPESAWDIGWCFVPWEVAEQRRGFDPETGSKDKTKGVSLFSMICLM